MYNEKNRSTRILKEVVGYFIEHHMYQFDLHYDDNRERFKLDIVAPCQQKPKNFDQLIADLKTPRQLEIDEYYNGLLGGHCEIHDYSFLGKSIDDASGDYRDGKLYLSLVREHLQ